MSQWKTVVLAGAFFAGVTGQAVAWQAEVPEGRLPPPSDERVTDGAIVVGDNPLIGIEIRDEDLEIVELGDYWIGLSCDQISDALRSHLRIDEGQGLIVRDAHEGKPAAKAGLKAHDVLLEADGEPVSNVRELIAAVQKAGEEELTLEIIRGGERQAVQVTPEKRPNEWRGAHVRVLPDGTVDPIRGNQWVTVHPGAVFRQWNHRHRAIQEHPRTDWPALPSGVSVSITRVSGLPTKIVVKRGDDEWNISEGEIDELPADLRVHVRRLLAGPAPVVWPIDQLRNRLRNVRPAEPTPVDPRSLITSPKPRGERRDDQLRELREELKRLGEKLEELDRE